MKMADYHVQYDKDKGDWSATREGASRASARSATQSDAIAEANRLADSGGGGEVNIHRKDNNQIRDKNTIGKKDPNPPRG
jgi:hypothetical protein